MTVLAAVLLAGCGTAVAPPRLPATPPGDLDPGAGSPDDCGPGRLVLRAGAATVPLGRSCAGAYGSDPLPQAEVAVGDRGSVAGGEPVHLVSGDARVLTVEGTGANARVAGTVTLYGTGIGGRPAVRRGLGCGSWDGGAARDGVRACVPRRPGGAAVPTIDVHDTTLAYDEVGDPDGVPLLLTHSLFFTRRMFDPLVEQLGAGYRVVAYDHRGQGESAPAPLEQLDMDTLTEDAAALVEALHLGPCHVLGNSMGGFVALRLAARRPDLVRSAVAVGSSAEEEHSLAAFAPLVAHLQQDGAADVIDNLMYIMFGDTSLAEPSAQTLAWREHMLGLDRSIGDAAHQVIHRRRIVEELDGCRVPVLAVAGAEDHAYPPPLSSDALAAASGGRSVVVTGAGHSVSLEQSARVAEHLRAFLADLEAGVPA